ncbi:MAG: hypothetical protein Q9216_001578 [Gyalolechia sp. 2 TL-2023]
MLLIDIRFRPATDSESAAPDLWAQRSPTDHNGYSHEQRRSTLAFQFDASGTSLEGTERPRSSSLNISRTIKLPVANTIFHNGRLSTIKVQRWVVDQEATGSTLRCVKSKWLDQQVLKVAQNNRFTFRTSKDASSPRDISFAAVSVQQRLRITVPLTGITRPRVVAAAMGNVVRSLFADSSSGKVIPASQELEAAIDQWIAKSDIGTQPPEVWALINPKTDPRLDALSFHDRIDRGTHFHKVLSGGGGWGNKQGLLALDPELDFDDASEISFVHSPDGIAPEEERRRNLGQIVNPGDTVEFFVRDLEVPFPEFLPTQNARDDSHEFPKLASTVFGTIPSTVDEMPAPSEKMADESRFSPCIYAWGHFGMLSEQGMSLTTTTADGQSMQTKIDIPYSTFSLEAKWESQPKRFRFKSTNNSIAEPEYEVKQIGSSTQSSATIAAPSAPQPTSEYLLLPRTPPVLRKGDKKLTIRKIKTTPTSRKVDEDSEPLKPEIKAGTVRHDMEDKGLEDPTIGKQIRITKHAIRDLGVDGLKSLPEEKRRALTQDSDRVWRYGGI